MARWKNNVFKLHPQHRWTARPGYRILVADKGAVRFNFPQSWVLVPDKASIQLYDRQPPHDDCRLEVSVMYLPERDWSGLPLARLVEEVADGDTRDILGRGEMHEIRRPNLEAAWLEMRFIDPGEQRAARSRVCLARRDTIQPLITCDFWADDAPRVEKVWHEVLRSLTLGEYVDDPTRG
ncbi:MAG: hypothetical protein FJZ47_17685 [Candidatus Tectomicrobia bacterium]|uniref:Uncharacterized protein n=1 Tax=Tectimicrobiota bacterium TaxID=2528274 RepID=A0A938B226_UNCTE|nr:hypothetical protein [Candidatus Tectomicrobia bacterium]